MKSLFTTLSIILGIGFSQAQTFTNYTDSTSGLANNGVNCLDVAANDVLWFGTQAGVSVFDGNNWTTHSTNTDVGFVYDVVTAIRVMSNGDVWIGSDFGAAQYDGTSWTTYTTSDGLGHNRVKVIHEDVNGAVWFGTTGGLTKYDGTTWISWGTADGLPFGGVTGIDEQPTGILYLGTALGGVIIFDNGISSEITEDQGLLNDKISALVTDDDGNHWFGTSDGVSVYNSSNELMEQHTIMYVLPPPDTLNPVTDVKIADNGTVWVGIYVDYLVTVGGVAAYNGATWVQFDEDDGLIGPVIRRLAIDSQDNCWVATSSGVSKISDVNLGSGNINFNPEVNTLKLYPNPTSSQVSIQIPNKIDVNSIEFFDSSLRLVKSENINQSSGNIQISVSDLKPGMYIARIGDLVSRLVIE